MFLEPMMRVDFLLEMDDLGRMEGRVLALFERLQAKPVIFCSLRINNGVVVHGTLEIEENLASRAKRIASSSKECAVPVVRPKGYGWGLEGFLEFNAWV